MKRSFIETGIALPEDGSRDQEIHIEGVIGDQIPKPVTAESVGTGTAEPGTT